MRSRWVGGALFSLLVIVLLVVYASRTVPDTTPRAPVAVSPKPSPASPPRKVYPLLPPEPTPAPLPVVAPREGGSAPPVPQEMAVAFSKAANGMMRPLRTECVDPWMEAEGPDEVEFAINTLVVDGRVAEFELLTVMEALPEDVLACIRDVAWAHDWPEAELEGEVRFQRSMHVKQRAWHGD